MESNRRNQCRSYAVGAKCKELCSSFHEVSATLHPKRITGSGPEQDNFSRFFAPEWTHMDVINNYQIHHIFYALEICLQISTNVSFNLSDWAWQEYVRGMIDISEPSGAIDVTMLSYAKASSQPAKRAASQPMLKNR